METEETPSDGRRGKVSLDTCGIMYDCDARTEVDN